MFDSGLILCAYLVLSFWVLKRIVSPLWITSRAGMLYLACYIRPKSTHVLSCFKPSSKIFYWPFQGGTSFVDLLCFCSVLCLLCFVRVCLYVLRGHLLGKGWPLGSRLWCLLLSSSLSHWCPGSGVVLDCIDSWSLQPYLLILNQFGPPSAHAFHWWLWWMDGWTDRQTDRQLCDQLAGMKAIKQCICNHRLLTSLKVQIGIYL